MLSIVTTRGDRDASGYYIIMACTGWMTRTAHKFKFRNFLDIIGIYWNLLFNVTIVVTVTVTQKKDVTCLTDK